jgi:hypothetical protein
MRGWIFCTSILCAVFISASTASNLWAREDPKNISDGAAKGQATDLTLAAPDGYGNAPDTAANTNYFYQYITDADSASTESIVIFFDETVPGTTSTTPVFEEFTGFSSDHIAVTITNENTNSDSLTLSNVGYMLSPTQIPLEDLNYPLPPSSSSGFNPLPNLDGTLAPSASSSEADVPEPLSTSLFAGLIGLTCLRHRTRARA